MGVLMDLSTLVHQYWPMLMCSSHILCLRLADLSPHLFPTIMGNICCSSSGKQVKRQQSYQKTLQSQTQLDVKSQQGQEADKTNGFSVEAGNLSSSDHFTKRHSHQTKPRIIIVTGKPGSGKGTHSAELTHTYKLQHLSTGDMLRSAISAGTAMGQEAKRLMDHGGLVGDDFIVKLVAQRTTEQDCQHGYVLDGFPRTVAQAQALHSLLEQRGQAVSAIILFDVPNQVLLERIEGRRVHRPSGRSYHIKFNPPKEEGKDDVTGEPLEVRADDNVEALQSRLEAYEQSTKPILAYFEQQGSPVLSVNTNRDYEVVKRDLLAQLDKSFLQ
eukprot:g1121.t1